MWDIVWAFAGGVAAWFVTNFLAQPLLRFYSLRSEIAAALSMYRNLGPYLDEKASPKKKERLEKELEEGHKALRQLATKLLAFHQTELVAARLLRRRGYNSRLAAQALFNISNTIWTFGPKRHEPRKEIDRLLKLRSAEED